MEAKTGSSSAGDGKGASFGFSGATLAVVTITSTLAQYVALASLGHLDDVEPQLSTGGLLGFLAAIVMWVKCRSWSYWKKWIWAWVGIVAVLAFVVTNLTVQAWQEEEARIAEQRAVQEAIAETRAAEACDQLYNEIQIKQSQFYARKHTTGGSAMDELLKYSRSEDSELLQLKDDYLQTC